MPTFAAVDIGSNSVRLKIARLENKKLKDLYEDREVTRLGEGVFKNGYLTPESMALTVKVLRRFHRAAQRLGADSVRVVATSATRDARNSKAFYEWVRSATGWNMEVISGLEEARLIHLGLIANLRPSAAKLLMIDLGGGSCELTVSDQSRIRDTVSLPLGAVRLTSEFLHQDPPRKGELKQLGAFIGREISRVSPRIAAAKVSMVLATSGTAAALAVVAKKLSKEPAKKPPIVTQRSMKRIVKLLCGLPVEGRAKLQGIGPRRAEIIIAGAMVYAELMERCHVQSFRYSPLGLRDGLLAQMAAEYDRSTRSGRQIESERWESIQRAMKHYGVDVNHAKDVRTSALQLFDSLRTLHRLPAEYREWLSAAAMLYEVGGYVNRSGRHRHAHYIIANSEILVYTSQQRRIIAAIARYLGKSRPTPGDAPTQGLSPVEQENIRKASLLLRLARAINLGRSGAVEKIRIQSRGGNVTLKIATRRRIGAELEMWAIEKDRTYFREVFGRELSVAAL